MAPPGPPRSRAPPRPGSVRGVRLPRQPRTLTQALVGGLGGAAGPRPVLEGGQAALAVHARGVVLAVADQPARGVRAARARMPVAFAPGQRARRSGGRKPGRVPPEGSVTGRPLRAADPSSVAQFRNSGERLRAEGHREPTAAGLFRAQSPRNRWGSRGTGRLPEAAGQRRPSSRACHCGILPEGRPQGLRGAREEVLSAFWVEGGPAPRAVGGRPLHGLLLCA